MNEPRKALHEMTENELRSVLENRRKSYERVKAEAESRYEDAVAIYDDDTEDIEGNTPHE